jgi:hypothetical protein
MSKAREGKMCQLAQISAGLFSDSSMSKDKAEPYLQITRSSTVTVFKIQFFYVQAYSAIYGCEIWKSIR